MVCPTSLKPHFCWFKGSVGFVPQQAGERIVVAATEQSPAQSVAVANVGKIGKVATLIIVRVEHLHRYTAFITSCD